MGLWETVRITLVSVYWIAQQQLEVLPGKIYDAGVHTKVTLECPRVEGALEATGSFCVRHIKRVRQQVA